MADKTPQKTEFFRIAVEGQTATDGREITRQIIEECVKTFNRDTYGVRINMEHLRGFCPSSKHLAQVWRGVNGERASSGVGF